MLIVLLLICSDNLSVAHKYSSISSLDASILRWRGGHSNFPSSASLLQLFHDIERSEDIDDILRLCEIIPAILSCPDKSIRISLADNQDALLAAHAIQKIANITININSNSSHIINLADIQSDRRFQQLTECVDSCISTLRIHDLANYIWSIAVLDVLEDIHAIAIFEEFSKRLPEYSITTDEVASIIWTLGCIKHTLGISNTSLMDESILIFRRYIYYNDGIRSYNNKVNKEAAHRTHSKSMYTKLTPGDDCDEPNDINTTSTTNRDYYTNTNKNNNKNKINSDKDIIISNDDNYSSSSIDNNEDSKHLLSATSLIRVLWAKALYGKHDEDLCMHILANAVNSLESESTSSLVTLLWSCSILRFAVSYEYLPRVIAALHQRIQSLQLRLHHADLSIIADSLRSIFYSIRTEYIPIAQQQRKQQQQQQHLEQEQLQKHGYYHDKDKPGKSKTRTNDGEVEDDNCINNGNDDDDKLIRSSSSSSSSSSTRSSIDKDDIAAAAADDEEDAAVPSPVLQLGNAVRRTLYLVTQFALNFDMSAMSTPGVVCIFRAASALGVCSRALLATTLTHIDTLLISDDASVSSSHAAAVLASLGVLQSRMTVDPATLPLIPTTLVGISNRGSVGSVDNQGDEDKELTDSFHYVSELSSSDLCILDQRSMRKLLLSPIWRRVAGRLSAICATSTLHTYISPSSAGISSTSSQLIHSQLQRAGQLHSLPTSPNWSQLDRIQLLNACWGIAELGHQYRALLRAVRKSVQLSLHELDAQSVARLTVAIAEEECGMTVGKSKGITGAKLDREFVIQVEQMALRRIKDMTAREQVGCLVAVAKLGRVPIASWRDRDASGGTNRGLDISEDTLSGLGTQELIEIFWAINRVPAGVVSVECVQRVQDEIHRRDLGPGTTGCSPDDILVLLRTLRNAHASKDTSLDTSHVILKTALLQHLDSWEKLHDANEKNLNNNKRDDGQHESTIDSVSMNPLPNDVWKKSMFSLEEKCEVMQALFDLKWSGKEFAPLTSYLRAHVAELIRIVSEPDAQYFLSTQQAYDLGRLEGLLSKYHDPPPQPRSSRYDLGKKILSRFFHGLPGWKL